MERQTIQIQYENDINRMNAESRTEYNQLKHVLVEQQKTCIENFRAQIHFEFQKELNKLRNEFQSEFETHRNLMQQYNNSLFSSNRINQMNYLNPSADEHPVIGQYVSGGTANGHLLSEEKQGGV